ncbi:MAG: AAA family ATPase [Rhodospirillales bacterium]|nr:AAA family ATPase [Rhodospirillales bacterium]
MSIPPTQAEVAAWLGHLAGAAPVETHISLVFLGRDTAWKLKKAVRLPFLDFTDLAARRHFAERELALNAAAAPGMYRDVVPVLRAPGGQLRFGDGLAPNHASGEVLDWVLRMARVPEADFLDAVAAAGRLDPPLLDAVADAAAAYHAARPPVAVADPTARMLAVAAGNTVAARAAGLDPAAVAAWDRGIRMALTGLGPWLAARARRGFVRRAHGDLHLGNLCLWHGRPVPFDALEFDEDMATIDLGYDLAFLLMDLDRRAGRAAANRVMNRYVARTGDIDLVAGLPAFLSLRAMVRAHVAARSGDATDAASYLDAALGYLRPVPPVVVAIGGLQGTGKSTLARALAPGLGRAPGALVLRSDETRKRLHKVAPEARLPQSAYSEAENRRVFRALATAARRAAAAGQAVIADATFLDPRHRRALARAAGPAAFVGLWLEAPLPVLEARLRARTGDASDATVAVLRASAAGCRPPRQGRSGRHRPGSWHRIDATEADAALTAARAVLPPR